MIGSILPNFLKFNDGTCISISPNLIFCAIILTLIDYLFIRKLLGNLVAFYINVINISYSYSTLILALNDGKYTMGKTILFLVFVALTLTGGWLVLRRSGNYDIDFFTKILGWILLIPGILGMMESLKMLQ